jgi:hypothetical protein
VLPNLTNSTAAQITEARQQHTGGMETFKACNLIQRTIIQQINTAIYEDCLANLIDYETGLREGMVPQIMKELFDTYGAITPQKQQMQEQLYNMANSTQQNQTMLGQMQALTTTICDLKSQVNNQSQPRGRGGGGRGRGSGRDRCRGHAGGRSGRANNRLLPKHCWTHGNCSHNGVEWETKSDGHLNDATYSNMQNGSTQNCQRL